MKDTINEINAQFIKLIKLVCSSGFESLSEDEVRRFVEKDKEIIDKFQTNLFAGWKQAQDEILMLQKETCKNLSNPKTLGWFYHRSSQRLLDCIVWHHFGPDFTDQKRIYALTPQMLNLHDHNIETHELVAQNINKDPNKFALISDLTSGLRIGDIFLVQKGKPVEFHEVKSGDVNKQIMDFIHNNEKVGPDFYLNPGKMKQFDRVLKQAETNFETLKLINNEQGKDKRFKAENIEVLITKENFQTFSQELDELISRTILIGSETIEDCLLLICIDTKKIENVEEVISQFIEQFEPDPKVGGYSFDWAHYLNLSTFMKPLFIQPLKAENTHSLFFREKIVFFYFSFTRFKNKFVNSSLPISIVSGKEFRKLDGAYKGSGYIGLKNKTHALAFDDLKGNRHLFSTSLFQRVPSFTALPSQFLKLQQQIADKMNLSSEE